MYFTIDEVFSDSVHLKKHRFEKTNFIIDKKGQRKIKNDINMSNYLIICILD